MRWFLPDKRKASKNTTLSPQKIDLGHNSTPVIEKEQIDRTFDVAGSKSILIFVCVSASRFFYLVQNSNIYVFLIYILDQLFYYQSDQTKSQSPRDQKPM